MSDSRWEIVRMVETYVNDVMAEVERLNAENERLKREVELLELQATNLAGLWKSASSNPKEGQ